MHKPIVTTLLASSNPYGLAQFYSFAMDAEIKSGFNNDHCLVTNYFGFTIQIYKPSMEISLPPKGNAVSLCLEASPSSTPIDSLKLWINKLISFGATAREELTVKCFGAESWIADPEENPILVFVPSIAPLNSNS